MKNKNNFRELNKVYESNNCGKFRIIKKIDSDYCMIRFESTGTIMKAAYSSINKGAVKDRFYPLLFDVAYIGNAYTVDNKTEYKIWYSLIKKCYDYLHSSYKKYGAVGATVCDRWLCFEYFLEDIQNMYNYERLIKDPKRYTILRKIKRDKNGILIRSTEFSEKNCYIGLRAKDPVYKPYEL